MVDGKMVGVVFRRAQNAGLIIPNEEIDAFLEDVKDENFLHDLPTVEGGHEARDAIAEDILISARRTLPFR